MRKNHYKSQANHKLIMATKSYNFTKAKLLAIKPPKKPEGKKGGVYDTYKDEKEAGLVLLVSNGGAKTFYLYRKINGRPERIRLGSFPDMSVENARNATIAAKKTIVVDKKNPNEERKKIKAEITFGEMFRQFMERYSKKHKKSWKYDEREINKFLPHWFNKKSSEISKQDIQYLHERIGDENGKVQANRLLERVSAIYNKNIEWGWEGSNPCNGVKKFKEKSRERFMQADEIPKFFQAVAEEENTVVADYILVSLLTGARKGNVLAMRWDQINLNLQTWRIPETKNSEPLTIHLVDEVIDILKKRQSENTKLDYGDKSFVFPGTGSTGHIADPKKAWRRVLKRSEITDLRIHDLRRTLGSYQAANGATTAIIGKSLGHKSQQATAIYERLNIDPVRDSVTKATKAIFELAKNKSHDS